MSMNDRGHNRPQEAGWSNRRIGRHLGRSDMVVARCPVDHRRHPVPSRETIRRDRSWLEEPRRRLPDPTS
ncbi:hypothetical protein TNCV_3991211 [Trichonephila clavipes]|uniref:Uncharacterized protein n=1 Tax=Trichonephila clavipes TaxID=2585209 RepID=A0A8X6SVZ7_TRICX|nr:hypothetical protein TNCV_3991211 [Trichonephila clavipes]